MVTKAPNGEHVVNPVGIVPVTNKVTLVPTKVACKFKAIPSQWGSD